ncbi:MAG TPA: septation protein SepH [Homoserinimonas sp.]|nr:septation protein SepH [Homoserinimonas sp.]
MQDLRVIGVENGALLVTSDDGEQYRIPIDEVLQSKIRQTVPSPGNGRKLSPREIQSHIRSGMSAQDVASITGVPLEYIEKFEGPVLAEREYVVTAALGVPVHTAMETDPLGEGSTFGTVIRERLHDLGAINERWASWKEQGGGWVVKLAFTAEQVDHDARWQFDPKKSALAPLNSDAVTLSQQGELSGALIPRLRAVNTEDRVPDTSRFDSGAFTEEELSGHDTAPYVDPLPFSRAGQSSVSSGAINRDSDGENTDLGHTADLLEALRRRRGEREAASFDDQDEARAAHPSTGSIRIIDVPLDDFSDDGDGPAAPTGSTPSSPVDPHPGPARTGQSKPVVSLAKSGKKGRAAMPSWDDIVFGAKSDDDL